MLFLRKTQLKSTVFVLVRSGQFDTDFIGTLVAITIFQVFISFELKQKCKYTKNKTKIYNNKRRTTHRILFYIIRI